MREITDGIHDDISIDEYHANRSHISATQIKRAKESLRLFNWHETGKIVQEQKTCFDFGNAFELALLSKDEYLKRVAVFPDQDFIDIAMQDDPSLTKPRASKKYRSEAEKWEIENAGKYRINETGDESFETIEHMLDSCNSDPVIKALIENTEYQLSLFWTDAATGLGLKTRPDVCKRKRNVLVNLKTIDDGSPESFSKELSKWEYPLQASIEIEGALRSGLMETVDNYLWLVCEKKAPYNATIYEYSKEDRAAGEDGLRFILDRIARAKKENKWPGYSDRADNQYGILTAKIPTWYRF